MLSNVLKITQKYFKSESLKSSNISNWRPYGEPIKIFYKLQNVGAFPMPQWVENPPAMQEMLFQSLGQEDPLEKEMATHSSILAWKILWTEETGGLQSMGFQRVGHDCDWAHGKMLFSWGLSENWDDRLIGK